jgi:hypothetical protein
MFGSPGAGVSYFHSKAPERPRPAAAPFVYPPQGLLSSVIAVAMMNWGSTSSSSSPSRVATAAAVQLIAPQPSRAFGSRSANLGSDVAVLDDLTGLDVENLPPFARGLPVYERWKRLCDRVKVASQSMDADSCGGFCP